MSHHLAELSESTEPDFSRRLRSLEATTGRTGIDVKLIAEIVSAVRRKTAELGMDPVDTTPEEMYSALQAKIAECDRTLAQILHAKQSDDVESIIDGIVVVIGKRKTLQNVWVVKHAVMKRIFKGLAPKKTLKTLGYKSLDSMIKREPIETIVCVARLVETAAWNERLTKQYARLTPSDFETRPMKIIKASSRWQEDAHQFVIRHGHNLLFSRELGAIVMLPLPVEKLPGIATVLSALVLHAAIEQRLYSAYFKLHQVRGDFGKEFSRAVHPEAVLDLDFAGHTIGWHVVLRHIGAREDGHELKAVLEPHVQAEDVLWQSVEEELCQLSPVFDFWRDTAFVASKDGDTVLSFNLIDNAVSYCNHLPRTMQLHEYMRQSLLNEVSLRYIGDSMLEPELFRTLQHGLLHNEVGVIR